MVFHFPSTDLPAVCRLSHSLRRAVGLFCRLRDSVHGIRAVSVSEGKEQARVCVCVCVCVMAEGTSVSRCCVCRRPRSLTQR